MVVTLLAVFKVHAVMSCLCQRQVFNSFNEGLSMSRSQQQTVKP